MTFPPDAPLVDGVYSLTVPGLDGELLDGIGDGTGGDPFILQPDVGNHFRL